MLKYSQLIMSTRPLSKALKEVAEKELNEESGRTENDISNIKGWIVKQPHLKARIEDQWILSFLRGCKFNLQETKNRIDYFYTMRSLIPEFFKNRDPLLSDVQAVLSRGIILPLPKTEDTNGPRSILCRFTECDPDIISVTTIVKVYFMIADILTQEDDNSVVSGINIIEDWIDFNYEYIPQFTPNLIKKGIACWQDSYPVRIQGMFILNCPTAFETVFNMIKIFMKEDLKPRMFMYSRNNSEKVYTQVPHSLFPREYGGSNSSVDEIKAEWKRKVESYRDWYLEDEKKYYTDEGLRIGKPYKAADIFGVEDLIRQLNTD